MKQSLILSAFTTVNACGRGLGETMTALREERTGLRPCDFEDAKLDTFIGRVSGLEDTPVAARLADYDCRNNRLAQMALQSDGFAEAVAAVVDRYGADRVAVIVGTSTSGVGEGEQAYLARDANDGALPDGFNFSRTHDFYSLAAFVSDYLEVTGPNISISAACASSNKVFVDAWQWIEAGVCDAAVVGGVDSLCQLTLLGFNSLELLSHGPCRPNDAQRSGLSIGEAAGFALLERDATPKPGAITLLGYGESSDAHHMSAPHPEGKGAIMAMRAALTRARLEPREIDYINLHGTGSAANDRVEDRAVFEIFGDRVPTSSTKGWTGHALGAAGITEAVLACLCLEQGFIPANLLLEQLDPAFQCAVTGRALNRPLSRVLSNSFGFGGSNCSIILGRVPE